MLSYYRVNRGGERGSPYKQDFFQGALSNMVPLQLSMFLRILCILPS